MFNNLNNQNPSNSVPVDDIFADTDKPEGNNQSADIKAQRVGLTETSFNSQTAPIQSHQDMSQQMLAAEVESEHGSQKSYLKIIAIIVGVIIFLVIVYFAYLNFFASKEANIDMTPITVPVTNNNSVINNDQSPIENNFVDVIPEEEMVGSDPTLMLDENGQFVSSLPGLEENMNNVATTVPESNNNEFTALVDSDGDGLSDTEELSLGTNINIIDTDNDGLTDYEEVKIYFSNPLVADTDGDSYLDGAEVKAGYDPNAVGAKLPGNQN